MFNIFENLVEFKEDHVSLSGFVFNGPVPLVTLLSIHAYSFEIIVLMKRESIAVYL